MDYDDDDANNDVSNKGGGRRGNDDWCWQWHGKSWTSVANARIDGAVFFRAVNSHFPPFLSSCFLRCWCALLLLWLIGMASFTKCPSLGRISSLAKCTDFDPVPLMYLQFYLMTMFGHFVFLLASIFHLAWSVISVIRIRLWSHWDSFYAAEYCDSQLFLPSASHVEEARFNIINLIILVLVSLISLTFSFLPDSLVRYPLIIHL